MECFTLTTCLVRLMVLPATQNLGPRALLDADNSLYNNISCAAPLTPSRDNIAIASLYREVENLDKQLATLEAAGTAESNAAQEVASDGGVVAKLEGLKAEKKRVKREIKAWLDDFEAREGRPALAE